MTRTRSTGILKRQVLLTAVVTGACFFATGSQAAGIAKPHPPKHREFVAIESPMKLDARTTVTISTKTSHNMNCSGGKCSPSGPKPVLNVNDLARLLVAGNVTIATSATAPDIAITASFAWESSNGLTLQAIANVTVNKSVSDEGSGSLTIVYDSTGAGGVFSFGPQGHITFATLANPLTINGQSYALVNNIRLMQREIGDNPSGQFALSQSYNARGDGKYTQSPIDLPFQGTFEGLGNAISGLRIESVGDGVGTGFFQEVGETGSVSHFNLKKIEDECAGICMTVGGLAGSNKGIIFGSAASGNVNVSCPDGACVVGGLVGTNTGTISFSHAGGEAIVTADSAEHSVVGGLVGWNQAGGAIDHSYATTTVSGLDDQAIVGGLIGENDGSADQTYATGLATAADHAAVGGSVGLANAGHLTNSFASAGASAGDDSVAGGLVGEQLGGAIDGCTESGPINGGQNTSVGGLLGFASGDTAAFGNSASYGMVTGVPGNYIGGFVGEDGNEGDMSNDGWDMSTSGIANPAQGAGNIPNDAGITGFN
ncbi:MAG TPA: GLUG motif-containing protein [Rhizomicrobium sp.]|jgi:hypothetical protein